MNGNAFYTEPKNSDSTIPVYVRHKDQPSDRNDSTFVGLFHINELPGLINSFKNFDVCFDGDDNVVPAELSDAYGQWVCKHPDVYFEIVVW